jgi:hypothetical protein
MGFGLRLKEKVKQVGKSNKDQPDKSGFIPTTYERTQLTYEEAVKFADSLKIIRRRISEANHARTKMLRDVESTLTGSLPCIHEIDPVTGEHTTQEAAPEGAANYVHTGTLTRLSEESDAKLQTQVFDPIDKWISEVDLFKRKMKVLENSRLELDGSRRDHINIENKIAKQEHKAGEVDAKHTTHIQSKDASVAGKRVAFEQLEAQLYEELQNIIGESGVLHTALDRALKLEIECFQRALAPISQTTSRLENLSVASGSPGVSPHSSVIGTGAQAPAYQKPGYEPTPGYGQTTATTTTTLPSAPTHSATGATVPAAAHPTVAPGVNVNYEKPYAA